MNHTYLKVGYACNNNCTHCVIVDQKKQALKLRGNISRSTKECKEEILKSKEKGAKYITFTGGEPTIRKDFFELLEFAKSNNFTIYLQSNGRAFCNENFAKKAVKYIDGFLIPIHSHKEEIHDMVTTKISSFNQTILGIKNLIKYNANIGIKVMVLNSNYKDLLKIVKLVQGLKLNYLRISFPHPNGNAYKNFDKVVPYYKDIKPYIQKCLDYCIKENIDLELETIMPCALDKTYPIKYFATIRINKADELEVKQLDDIFDDWSQIRKKIHKKNLICNQCIYTNFCNGYWREYVEKRGFGEFCAVREIPLEIKKILIKQLKGWK